VSGFYNINIIFVILQSGIVYESLNTVKLWCRIIGCDRISTRLEL